MTRGRAATIGLTAALAVGVPAADGPEKPKDLGLMERTVPERPAAGGS